MTHEKPSFKTQLQGRRPQQTVPKSARGPGLDLTAGGWGWGPTSAHETRGGPAFPNNGDAKGVNKRSIFLTHETRMTFSKKYFEDKNAKNTYKTKKHSKKERLYCGGWEMLSDNAMDSWYLFFVSREAYMDWQSIELKVDIVKLPWTLLQYSIPIYI